MTVGHRAGKKKLGKRHKNSRFVRRGSGHETETARRKLPRSLEGKKMGKTFPGASRARERVECRMGRPVTRAAQKRDAGASGTLSKTVDIHR